MAVAPLRPPPGNPRGALRTTLAQRIQKNTGETVHADVFKAA
jgi:hypothetical protein